MERWVRRAEKQTNCRTFGRGGRVPARRAIGWGSLYLQVGVGVREESDELLHARGVDEGGNVLGLVADVQKRVCALGRDAGRQRGRQAVKGCVDVNGGDSLVAHVEQRVGALGRDARPLQRG